MHQHGEQSDNSENSDNREANPEARHLVPVADTQIPVRLLLVDDQPANLIALQALLAPLGHTLIIARSGREALRCVLEGDQAGEADFAAILLDVQMPDMDGFETAALIKQRERSRYIPILFITAIGPDEAYLSKAYRLGAVDFMSKPFHPDVLTAKVSVFVELYRQREQIRRQAALLRERELMAQHAYEIEQMAQRQRRFLREVLFSLTEGRLWLCDTAEELPPPLPVASTPVELSSRTLRQLRHQMVSFARDCDWPPERLHDFETAVGEAAMNAVVHGQGGLGQVYTDPSNGLVQVRVQDRGKGIAEESLHRATLEKGYSSAGTLGHGFHLMLRTADRVHLLTGANGTSVVLEQGPTPPAPAWMSGLSA